MGVFTLFSYSAAEETVSMVEAEPEVPIDPPNPALNKSRPVETTTYSTAGTGFHALDSFSQTPLPVNAPLETPIAPDAPLEGSLPLAATIPVASPPTEAPVVGARVRRFSFRSFSFSKDKENGKAKLPSVKDQPKREKPAKTQSNPPKNARPSKSDKRAKKSALIMRSLIVGPGSAEAPKVTAESAKPQLNKIKAQLLQPKSANKVIAQLRALPVGDDPKGPTVSNSQYRNSAPIHAVCLEHTDLEEEHLHFAQFNVNGTSGQNFGFSDAATVSVDTLTTLFNDMKVVDLLRAPDFGLGQPGDGEGLLAGALPTPETVIQGIKQITPELMALGYATGRAILPDHTGIYPPTDRMSVLTYWWGLELLLPPPSIAYLDNAESIANAVVNFLSALAMINNGVREILPFVRYIAQFIEFEFSAIKKQNLGQGVVCAATWIMPAAMVPRPWDFPLPPSVPEDSDTPQDSDVPDRVPIANSRGPSEVTVLHPSPSSLLDVVTTS
ncbi:hypothetical protein BDQ12DRAFT_30183 [Crucibulum laeve]|uniref:Uncharacterized protein n=1 Tax=Crucibulum laeve TaxID=68775 RepID=A0A5C3MH35_9AGAR|nr:hypothetical protein BDQ12DRAFT_30183 [Crucibulum laeve]